MSRTELWDNGFGATEATDTDNELGEHHGHEHTALASLTEADGHVVAGLPDRVIGQANSGPTLVGTTGDPHRTGGRGGLRARLATAIGHALRKVIRRPDGYRSVDIGRIPDCDCYELGDEYPSDAPYADIVARIEEELKVLSPGDPEHRRRVRRRYDELVDLVGWRWARHTYLIWLGKDVYVTAPSPLRRREALIRQRPTSSPQVPEDEITTLRPVVEPDAVLADSIRDLVERVIRPYATLLREYERLEHGAVGLHRDDAIPVMHSRAVRRANEAGITAESRTGQDLQSE